MKKAFFSVLAVAIALAGSAFTTALVPAGTVYGNLNNTSTTYTQRADPFDSALCNPLTNETECAYQVTSAGTTFVTASSYTRAQLETFFGLGYVTKPSSTPAIYIGN